MSFPSLDTRSQQPFLLVRKSNNYFPFALCVKWVVVGIMVLFVTGSALHTQGMVHTSAQSSQQTTNTGTVSPSRPVLAFYYSWYSNNPSHSSWDKPMLNHPTVLYNSDDDNTIDQQVKQAAASGITGFISSWWGQKSQTDNNFDKLLKHSASLGQQFNSTVYFESDSPAFASQDKIVTNLQYLSKYMQDPHFFHWQGKPVIFFWDPLSNGRDLNMWAQIRHQVDPNNRTIWSAEGTSESLLTVFDGIHLFSGGYWGLKDNSMTSVDQGFRTMVDHYNTRHAVTKIWAAGVLPGYDDTRIAGRTGTFAVPRNDGQTYRISWTAASLSNPEWITISTFNEWFEGATIEPSREYANRYLALTAQLTGYHPKDPSPRPTPPILYPTLC